MDCLRRWVARSISARHGRSPFRPNPLHEARCASPANARKDSSTIRTRQTSGTGTRQLALAWHRLDAWKDVPPGLARLRKRFLIAPVSNGNIAIMSDLARRNSFHWDAILGADLARDYKPKAVVSLAAVEALHLEPRDCMM